MNANFATVDLPQSSDGWKTRHSRVFEALGGKWTRNRGYHIQSKRVALFWAMIGDGWDAGYKGIAERSSIMQSPNGERMSVFQALRPYTLNENHT